MKIKSVDIAAFGKFKDFHLDFKDGMTVIFGENENGKTTIMAFIRMMFYGNTGKSSDIEKNPRIKYRPWNSDFMAGSITFSHCGSNYRLEREFKKSNSTDKITLIDLDTGVSKSLSGSDDIGVKFFGLTDAAFERSVFVGELGAPSKNESADGEINSKLSNIAVTGDEDVSFEKISARLLKAKEALMSKGGKKGKYDKALLELEDLEKRIFESLQKEEHLKLLEDEARAKEAAVKECAEESARLFELLKNADKIRKIKRIEKYVEVSLAASDNDKALTLSDSGLADGIFLAEIRAKKEAEEKTKEKIDNLLSDIEETSLRIDELSAEIKPNNSSSKNKLELETLLAETNGRIEENKVKSANMQHQVDNAKQVKKPLLPLIISGAIILVASAVSFVLKFVTVGMVLLALGVILLVLGIALKKSISPDNSNLNRELLALSTSLSSLLEEKQVLLNRLKNIEDAEGEAALKSAATKALLEEKKAELAGKRLELDSLKKFYKEQSLKLFEFCSKMKAVSSFDEVESLIAELSVLLEKKDKLTQNLSLLGETINCSSLEDAKTKLAAYSSSANLSVSEEELETAKEKFKIHSEKLAAEKSALAELNTKIKALAESTESTAVLIRQKEILKEKICEYKKYCDSCDLALSVLADAFKELRRNYSGVLDSKAAQIFSRLTGEKYNSVNVSKNFEIGVTTKEAFGLKDAGYLSSGTADQAYLALRLAVTELITESVGKLPIFMDDALTQYDDERAKSALEFLKEYSADRQLLLFTCHSYFKNVAESLSIKTFEL